MLTEHRNSHRTVGWWWDSEYTQVFVCVCKVGKAKISSAQCFFSEMINFNRGTCQKFVLCYTNITQVHSQKINMGILWILVSIKINFTTKNSSWIRKNIYAIHSFQLSVQNLNKLYIVCVLAEIDILEEHTTQCYYFGMIGSGRKGFAPHCIYSVKCLQILW